MGTLEKVPKKRVNYIYNKGILSKMSNRD